MAKKATNCDVSEEFWSDDAAAIAERERVDTTGLRMPAAASSKLLPPTRSLAITPKAARGSLSVPVIASVLIVAFIVVVVLSSRPLVTLSEFNELQPGMSIEQCNKTVGSVSQSVSSAAFGDRHFAVKVDTFGWQNKDGSVATIAMINGQLHAKVQIGLK